MSWLDSTAISWDPEFLPPPVGSSSNNNNNNNDGDDDDNNASCCCYWDRELIALVSSLDDDTATANIIIADKDICSISYRSMLVAAVLIARSLREHLHRIFVLPPSNDVAQQEDEEHPNELGASVVVAIPEGPFLPIAILAVHLLNRPPNTTTNSQEVLSTFAVLVPLEPGEGKERLGRMLVDLRPALILCLVRDDVTQLSEILASIEPADDGTTSISNEGLFQPAQPEVIDFGKLLRTAIATTTHEERDRIQDYIQSKGGGGDLLQALSNCEQSLTSPHPYRDERNRISHIVFTSGTTGIPKGCISSIHSLRHYLTVKNQSHGITSKSIVLLASALSFDPCLSDILATVQARATLVIAPRTVLIQSLSAILRHHHVTHVLCTPTLWGMVHGAASHSTTRSRSSGMPVPTRSSEFPSLQVVALGGEVIPKHVVKAWAARRNENNDDDNKSKSNISTGSCQSTSLRLCATYGVTEACVYQTFGEVWRDDDDAGGGGGQNVGKPLCGLAVRICDENEQSVLKDVCDIDVKENRESSSYGEIVLSGMQIDEYSGYLNRKQQNSKTFVKDHVRTDNDDTCATVQHECWRYHYRTGDRGFIDPVTKEVHILGRIHGEDGMVKVNGVRVELGEVENALIDDVIVSNCLATTTETNDGSKQIHAFCILSQQCSREIGLDLDAVTSESGVLLTTGPLLLLLRARCKERLRAGVTPSNFVIIKRLPLSPTGKRDRRRLPSISDCVTADSLRSGSNDSSSLVLLWEYGSSGAVVAEQVIDCLNLQPCQRSLLTTGISFGMLGGDSLAATRLTRSLYAHHYGVLNSRFLGGSYGVLEGPFATLHLLEARTMGEYVDWLDSHRVCVSTNETNGKPNASAIGTTSAINNVKTRDAFVNVEKSFDATNINGNIVDDASVQLCEALLEAATSGHSLIACALLDHGVDPNLGQHSGRLAKTSGTVDRKRTFRSNPLHLACSKGDSVLVTKLLEKGCKFNSPDACGSFPIHLAASSTTSSSGSSSSTDITSVNEQGEDHVEDERRCECVQYLLQAGAPLTMKDGNKQTVLHCAARAGHCKLLTFLMGRWAMFCSDFNKHTTATAYTHTTSPLDWTDRWFRTPVHWAVLNGHVEALKILLDGGCNPNPFQPKNSNRRTSVAMETPLEICERLYCNGTDDDSKNDTGRQMREVLQRASSRERNSS